MPNWCENELRVTGDPEDLEKFKKFVRSKNGPLDFEQIIPYPTEYERLDRQPEIDNAGQMHTGWSRGGYDWSCKNRGTKTICPEVKITEEAGAIIYEFDTAWSPPLPVIRRLIEWFPELDIELKYGELGNGFKGVLTGVNGQVTEDRCEKWDGFCANTEMPD
jgi:Api92-like protein with ferredoxin domain